MPETVGRFSIYVDGLLHTLPEPPICLKREGSMRIIQRRQNIRIRVIIPAWLNAAAEEANVNFSQVLQNALRDVLAERA